LYLKFDTNTVTINIAATQFPSTLFIYNGQINRISTLPTNYYFDVLGNIQYGFVYDSSLNILMHEANNMNNSIFNGYEYINTVLQLYDVSTNFVQIANMFTLTTYDINELNNGIETGTYLYSYLIGSIQLAVNDYCIINNQGVYIVYSTIISNNTIIKFIPINSFIFNSSYNLSIGLKYILNNTGYDKLDTRTVFYYFETFNISKYQINKLLLTCNDYNFKNQIFTLNECSDKIYNKINIILQNNDPANCLNQIPDELFLKNITNNINININNNFETIQTNIINDYNISNKNIQNAYRIIARPEIPTISWIPYLGHFLINTITFNIDDNLVEQLTGQLIHIFNFFNSTTSKDYGLNKIIGNTPNLTLSQPSIAGTTLFIPLPFYFKNKEKAIPLIALIYSKLSIVLQLADLNSVLISPPNTNIKLGSKLKARLISSYVFLDEPERIKFAEMRHEYLVEIKKINTFLINSNSGSIKLDLNLPTKDILWFYLDNNIIHEKNYWNYTGLTFHEYNYLYILANNFIYNDDVRAFIISLLKGHENIRNYYNRKNNQPLISYTTMPILPIHILTPGEVYQIQSYIYNRSGNANPFINTKLNFNGHVRFNVDGLMSTVVTSLFTYNDFFPNGLNAYSFSRYPRSIQHTGALNFKFANNIHLDYNLGFTDNHTANGQINVVTRSYNVLRIASGIGCLSW